MVIFGLAGQRLALPVEAVHECLPLPRLWRRPGSPASLAGFFSLGGVVLPVIDLAVLLGLRPAGSLDGTGIDMPEQGGLYRPLLRMNDVALLVDSLDRVAPPDPATIGPATTGPATTLPATTGPAMTGLASDRWQHGCIARHLFADGAPVALLDPSRILLADEQARLDMLRRDAMDRARGWDAAAVESDAG